MESLSTLFTAKPPQIPKTFLKRLNQRPPEGTQGFYFLFILLANTKAGTDSNKSIFHALAIEDTEPVV